MDFSLTHSRHDPAHCLAPGLFRSLKKGDRKKNKLDITYKYGNHEEVRFIGFEPLGADDLRLLQGLVALAGPKGVILTPNPTAEIAIKLRQLLDPLSDAVNQDALVVKSSMRNILLEIGLSFGGDNLKSLKASLLRMSNITVVVKKDDLEASFHLLSYVFKEKDDNLFVCLNPRITQAVLGKTSFVRIEMDEIRGLKSDPSRLIHQRLCSWIKYGKSEKIDLDTISGYIWHDISSNVNTNKSRKQIAKSSLHELEAVGWVIKEITKDKYQISRPASKESKQSEKTQIEEVIQ